MLVSTRLLQTGDTHVSKRKGGREGGREGRRHERDGGREEGRHERDGGREGWMTDTPSDRDQHFQIS